MADRPYGHESSAINTRKVLAAIGTLAAFVMMAVGVLYLVKRFVVMPDHAQIVTAPAAIPPKPRLQPHPNQDITLERIQKHTKLSQYGWLDDSRHFARIPIGRAMQLYARQHEASATPATSTSVAPRVQP